MKRVSHQTLASFMRQVLRSIDVREDVSSHLVHALIESSLRGVDSHGVRLFPHYIRGVRGGRINPNPVYRFHQTSPSTGRFDADHTFGHAACMEAARKAVALATDAGSAHIAVFQSSHFGAAATFAMEIARNDMIGMSFTNTDALVKTYGGKSAFLGNNPICIAVPCDGEEPICLDMATSIVTFNKIKQLRERRLKAEPGVGADDLGNETTDPDRISMLNPIGGYKGYGLSFMVEVFCSLLTGMPYGPFIPKMFEAPMDQKRNLGQFIIALRIDGFQEIHSFKKRMATFVQDLRKSPPFDPGQPIQVPGDPEKEKQKERSQTGIPLHEAELSSLRALSSRYNFPGVKLL